MNRTSSPCNAYVPFNMAMKIEILAFYVSCMDIFLMQGTGRICAYQLHQSVFVRSLNSAFMIKGSSELHM